MGRPGPALFELIRGGSAPPPPPVSRGGAPEKPLVRITPKAAAEPVTVREPEPAAAPQPGKPAEKAWAAWNKPGALLDFQRSVTVPMSAILLTIGVVIALLVIVWATAWTLGGTKGEQAATRDLKREDIPVNQGLLVTPPKAPEPKTLVRENKPQPVSPVPAGGDPRVAGMNYYLLASGLDKDGARAIAEYLTQNGLPAAAAVDTGASGPNNRGSFVVFAAKGITPEDYKNRAAVRTEIESAVSRLGKLWQKDRKGQTDFTGAYWKKFAG
jgi:hypothetical protein